MTPRPTIKIDRKDLRAADFLTYWNGLSSDLIKWILATLITVNTGGMFVALNSKVHPSAIDEAISWFFLGLVFALLAGLSEIVRSSHQRDLLLNFVISGDDTAGRPYRIELNSWKAYASSISLSIASLMTFAFGGLALSIATKPCSANDLEFSIEMNDNIAIGGKGNSRPCYFYSIDGLPDDPLQRAIIEREAVKKGLLKAN